MLARSSQTWIFNRSLYSSIFSLSSRFSSSDLKTTFPSSKLLQSYYHHALDIPLLYHTVGQHLDQLANKYPNHECYAFKGEGNKRYTYKSFLDEVDSLATSLIELGFEKGDRIGVWLPNTSESCAMTYAASKVGLIKVNINPAYMERELTYCINKVGCKGLVMRPNVKTIDCMKIINKVVPELVESKGELNAKLVPTLKHVILTAGDYGKGNESTSRILGRIHLYSDLIRKGAGSRQEKRRERQSQFDGDTPLAIFYTSGTTGQPKAATLTNSNLLNVSIPLYYTHPTFMSRTCCPVPAFHIFGEVGGTLNINAPCYFTAFPAILPDTVESMRTVQEEKCTALIGPPIIFRDILHHPKRKEYDMSSLLFGMIGAAPVNPLLMEQMEREIPIKTMSQVYGQTENTGALVMSIFAEDDKQRRYNSVGKAMPRIEMKIVDANDRIVPIGDEGEICARSFNIMKGYYGEEEKTRDTVTSSGWLKTGDIGSMDEYGYIYYRSRRKELIIVGGINVYPVEIENYLLEHPKIVEAQVFSIPNQRYGEVVCAWVKAKAGTKIDDVEEVRNFLSTKVAFFKVPKHVKVIESFIPFTTATGKIQKFKLTEAMMKELSTTSS
ncbi:unnamed protein product [Rotaria sp. Silwood2]|nr:unnamed protein product [Rotaria sp. Silwood2]CAF2529243.1 unnamed protein product [Rotaria sp. Silwood2]CAF2940310.1 unnamed protein product [Rotaria sp. Silwood2]CAF3875918.1 unnamed protein product [Rotaria sp. Silwood2]CAF4133930.1 unnamed protein product [Rotaria sp. Silwood2]